MLVFHFATDIVAGEAATRRANKAVSDVDRNVFVTNSARLKRGRQSLRRTCRARGYCGLLQLNSVPNSHHGLTGVHFGQESAADEAKYAGRSQSWDQIAAQRNLRESTPNHRLPKCTPKKVFRSGLGCQRRGGSASRTGMRNAPNGRKRSPSPS